MTNRKLIRASIEKKPRAGATARRKTQPADGTGAEVFYYLKQIHAKTEMLVTLLDGEELKGIIDWYDRDCLKLNRPRKPNLVIRKSAIKYLCKAPKRR